MSDCIFCRIARGEIPSKKIYEDEYGTPGVYYYSLKRGPSPVWTKHAISFNEGVGAGLHRALAHHL